MGVRTNSRKQGESTFTRSASLTLAQALDAVGVLLRDPRVTDLILEDDAAATLEGRVARVICIGRCGAEPPL